ncbi:hypothetical protein T06_7565 [Trichinella sp. T6]|nr:hypothetical protein T06_7565 [Trichinella sp. T6]
MIGNCSTQVADMTAPTDKNILQPFLGSCKKQQLSRSSHFAKTERESFRVVRWTPRHHLRVNCYGEKQGVQLALRNRCFRTRSNVLLPRGFLDSDEQVLRKDFSTTYFRAPPIFLSAGTF